MNIFSDVIIFRENDFSNKNLLKTYKAAKLLHEKSYLHEKRTYRAKLTWTCLSLYNKCFLNNNFAYNKK